MRNVDFGFLLYSYMNLSLGKAVYCDTQQNEYYFDDLFIQARNIRYVHIPETVSKIHR